MIIQFQEVLDVDTLTLPTTTGNLKSLESLTKLTSVKIFKCDKIEGKVNRSHEMTTLQCGGAYSGCCSIGNKHFCTCKYFQRITNVVTTDKPNPGDKEAFETAHPNWEVGFRGDGFDGTKITS